jgi:hypothetical protein
VGIAQEPRFADLQTCILAIESNRKHFRQLVVNVSMATDIMNPDVVLWHKKTWEKLFNPSLSSDAFLLNIDINCLATIVIEHIIQALHVDVFFSFQPSNAAVGGGSNMVGVTNDLK